MNAKQRNFYSGGSIVLLSFLFIALVILSGALLKGHRLDLTRNQQYTLSEGTMNILAGLQEPVNFYLFFSEQASRDLPQIRSYARWAGEMLDEMAAHSDGALRIHRVDPKPFSTDEDKAAQFGLQAIPLGSGSDVLYFGLAGTNTLDDLQLIPFLQPSKEAFLEYDLAKMVSGLSHPEQQKLGLMSSLDMQAGFDPATQGIREAWTIFDQLDQLFDIEIIPPDSETLPSDLNLLLLVHPKQLSQNMQYQIDQFVLKGGRLVAFLDPFAEADVGDNPSDPMARFNAGSSSTLDGLLTAWGVDFDPTQMVGDARFALQVGMGGGAAPVRHLAIISATAEGLNREDIVSAELEAINFSSSGWLKARSEATTHFTSLVHSSENAAGLDASRMRFLSNPQDLLDGFVEMGEALSMVARITGPTSSAFAGGFEGMSNEPHIEQSIPEGINVLLFADTDVLSDRFWVQKQNFLGQTLVNSFADNGSLVINAVDHLMGSPDLISVRARATTTKPFSRVENLRFEAEARYRATEEKLQSDLEETERKISEMQTTRNDGDLTVFSQEQSEEVQRFMDQRVQIRTDLRQVRHDLDREIDALGTRLKLLNIALVPLLVIVFALVYSHRRHKRREGELL
ncbi:MAG: ABC-type uncharacterized transport system involved in gliding motility auxiliary subunit [Lysobacterales bacterium]|jgi:ABC-type uncharacterized transport system involved in gliding motility auxiliary subunit